MAIIYADQVSEMAIRGTYAGRPVATVLHFVNDEGAVSDGDKAKDILNAWQDLMMPYFVSDYVLTEVVWRSLDRDDNNQGQLALDPAKPTSGSNAGAGAPPNVAVLVKKITNDRGRGQRDGRMFLPGIPEADVNNAGTVTDAWRNGFQTNLDDFVAAVNDDAFGVGGGSGLVVLNTTPESRLPGTMEVDLTYRTVGSLLCDTKVASQRDRLR